MNNNWMLLALLLGGLFFFRHSPTAREAQLRQPSDFTYTGGEGTGYGIDVWGDEG